MKMPTDNELLITGLNDHLRRLNHKAEKDIEAFQDERMSLTDLVKYLTTLDKEITKTIERINKISPQFAADDIPF